MFPVLASGFILAFVSCLWLLFWFLFLSLVWGIVFIPICSFCFDACFYSTAHAPWDARTSFFLVFLYLVCLFLAFHALSNRSGHTFFSPFSLWYAFFLLFTLFRTARGILFSHLSLFGMPFSCLSCSFGCPRAYFSLFFHSLVCLSCSF